MLASNDAVLSFESVLLVMATRALLVIFIGSQLLWTDCNAKTFQCYSCSMSGGDVDRKCLTDPAAVSTYPFVNCNKKYCIIIRIQENDPPGKIYSFLRGCEDNVQEGVVVDSARTTYTRKCTANLCNDWDGIAAKPGGSSGSGGGSGSGGETGTIITKGNDNGAIATSQLMSAMALVCFVFLLRLSQ